MSRGINSRLLEDLHPALERGARELMRRMALAGFPHVGISSTYRNNAHQNWLFEQGRTRPGNIVTNARGGQSIHNYRLAFDIFQNIRSQEWNNPRFFETAGRIWQEMGGEWGGEWVGFVDRPHMQYLGGLTLRDLQNGHRLPDDARMAWEAEAAVGTEEEEDVEMRYNTIDEVPGWALPTVEKLMAKHSAIDDGFVLRGDEHGNLNLSEDMLRQLVFKDRLGLCGE